MKKIININFQGRVIPIEEPSYEMLKQYVQSLRTHFANEEGHDEIMSDIEGRIAELFSEQLKKGTPCITDNEVNIIIANIGHPEYFDTEKNDQSQQAGSSQFWQHYNQHSRGSFFRDAHNKILGGVCAGIAYNLRIDPSIVRIVFALLTFGVFGAGIIVYLLLWIILPVRMVDVRTIDPKELGRRLYRDPNNKVIAGVASGIAAYFNISTWIPRLIFAVPLIIMFLKNLSAGVVSFVFQHTNLFTGFTEIPHFFHYNSISYPFFSFSFNSMFLVIYVLLWIVLPEATTASEKLAMRGERVDINSIKNSIQEEIEQTKQCNQNSDTIGFKNGNSSNKTSWIIFKIMLLCVVGLIAFMLFTTIIRAVVGNAHIYPFTTFLIDGTWQYIFVYGALILFVLLPVIAIITWIVRQVFSIKSNKHHLRYTFIISWFVGLLCVIAALISIAINFRREARIDERVAIVQPSKEKLIIRHVHENVTFNNIYHSYSKKEFYGIGAVSYERNTAKPFYFISKDSVAISQIDLRIEKSSDSNFHVLFVKHSRGATLALATSSARKIQFIPVQNDSVLLLPHYFMVSEKDKFHNQYITVIIKVPLGKKIELDKIGVNENIQYGDHQGENRHHFGVGEEYIMTDKNGLQGIPSKEEEKNKNEELMNIQEELRSIEKEKQDFEKDLQQEKIELEKEKQAFERDLQNEKIELEKEKQAFERDLQRRKVELERNIEEKKRAIERRKQEIERQRQKSVMHIG